MPPKGHAVLSASSSERWLNCPPSARLCEAYEDKGSDYAAEGTDAHALAESRLKQALGIPTEDPVENLTWYNAEMEDCAQGYAAYVVELLETAKQTCSDPVVMIEQRVDFSRWVPGGFGTGDCICIAEGLLNIVDLKYGAGIEVSADHNPQMILFHFIKGHNHVSSPPLSEKMGGATRGSSTAVIRVIRSSASESAPLRAGSACRPHAPWPHNQSCRFRRTARSAA